MPRPTLACVVIGSDTKFCSLTLGKVSGAVDKIKHPASHCHALPLTLSAVSLPCRAAGVRPSSCRKMGISTSDGSVRTSLQCPNPCFATPYTHHNERDHSWRGHHLISSLIHEVLCCKDSTRLNHVFATTSTTVSL